MLGDKKDHNVNPKKYKRKLLENPKIHQSVDTHHG